MRKKKEVLILSIIVCAVTLVVAVGTVYAYFSTSTKSEKVVVGSDITVESEKVINIGNVGELFKYTNAENYNDENKVSAAVKRATLRLTNDITMDMDIFVTADVHLDLNGHTLYLNGKNLYFQHGYSGTLVIYSGKTGGAIDNSQGGMITIDTPNATFFFDSQNISYSESVICVLNMEKKTTAYNCFYMVATALLSDYDSRPKRKNYSEIISGNILTGNTMSCGLFLDSRGECELKTDGAGEENCAFVFGDVDLPYHYFSRDIQITYSSSNPELLTNYGNLRYVPITYENITLTVTISCTAWGADTVSCTFPIHVVNIDDYTTVHKASRTMVKSFFAHYLADGKYVMNNAVDVPVSLSAMGVDFEYSFLAADKNTTLETASGIVEGKKVYRLVPDSICKYLKINMKAKGTGKNGSTQEVTLILPVSSTYVPLQNSIARILVNGFYGGAIIYDSTEGYTQLYTLEQIKAGEIVGLPDTIKKYIDEFNVTAIEYELTDEAKKLYTITGNHLVLKEGIIPSSKEEYKSKYLKCTFRFGENENAETASENLYIEYVTSNGDTASGYWVYYNEYSETVPSEIITQIELPFAYGDGMAYGEPYTCYDFAVSVGETKKVIDGLSTSVYYTGTEQNPNYELTKSKPDGLKISLVDQKSHEEYVCLDYDGYTVGREKTSVSNAKSLVTVFNRYLADKNKTLNDLKNAIWILSIDASKLSFDDIELLVLYNYSFSSKTTEPSWTSYVASLTENETTTNYFTALTTSKINMEGGLIYAPDNIANHVPDSNLFVWMYNSFNPDYSQESKLTEAKNTVYIRNDWLLSNVDLIKSESTLLQNTTNWYGIQNLKGTEVVDLSGTAIDGSLMGYLAQMSAVKNLVLKNCGLKSDIIGDKLKSLGYLKSLDVSDNKIDTFEWLLDLDSVQTVYLQGNKTDTKGAEEFWGSEGMSNFQIYRDLGRKGIAVYYTINNNNTAITFDSADERNDYERFKDIEYQSQLSKDVSIEKAYSKFMNYFNTANAKNILSLDHDYSNVLWEYGNDDISEPVTVNNANYFKVTATLAGNENIKMTVKYYVDRY